VVEPRSVPELDGEQIVGMSVSRREQPLARLGAIGQPWWELVMHRDELAARTQRHQRGHEIPLLFGGRLARNPVLALVSGEAPIRLDVEAELLGSSLDPSLDDLRPRDAVKGRVDLHEREILRVERQLLLLPDATLQLGGIEVGVVGPIAGPDRNRRAHMCKQ
jgi:hypothetical protein